MKSYKNMIIAALVVMLAACLVVHFVHIQGHTLTAETWRDHRPMLTGQLLESYAYPGASKQALEDIIGSPYMEMIPQLRQIYFPGTEDTAQIYNISSVSRDSGMVYTYLAVFYNEDTITGSYVFTTGEKIESGR